MKRRKENLFVCECGHRFVFSSLLANCSQNFTLQLAHTVESLSSSHRSHLEKKNIQVKRKNLVGSADACQPAYETTSLVELHAAFPSP